MRRCRALCSLPGLLFLLVFLGPARAQDGILLPHVMSNPGVSTSPADMGGNIDELLSKLDVVKSKKAELEKAEKDLMALIKDKLKQQHQALQRLGVGDEEAQPVRQVSYQASAGVCHDGGEERALQTIRRLGGDFTRDEKSPGTPVIGVRLNTAQVTDEDMKDLAALKHLQWMGLNAGDLTDAGLKELAALKQLRLLHLFKGTRLTAPGLAELQQALPGCRIER